MNSMDMFTHLSRWVEHIRLVIGRELSGDDYIFPHISANGMVHIDCLMDHNKVQELINDFTSEAGLTKHFAMHCFHRGGAQYQLMHAPIGQRWPLTMVRWWGGWVVGEHVSHSHDD